MNLFDGDRRELTAFAAARAAASATCRLALMAMSRPRVRTPHRRSMPGRGRESHPSLASHHIPGVPNFRSPSAAMSTKWSPRTISRPAMPTLSSGAISCFRWSALPCCGCNGVELRLRCILNDLAAIMHHDPLRKEAPAPANREELRTVPDFLRKGDISAGDACCAVLDRARLDPVELFAMLGGVHRAMKS
jgi:hypothetical protein